MKYTIPEVDAYIAKAAPFAQPILTKIRSLFHQACPDIQETMKWSCPFFEYHGIVGGMGAFKKHVNMVLWKGERIGDTHQLFSTQCNGSQSVLKLTSRDDFPKDKLLKDFIQQLAAMNQAEASSPKPTQKRKPVQLLPMPDELKQVLKKNKKARDVFEGFIVVAKIMCGMNFVLPPKRWALRARFLNGILSNTLVHRTKMNIQSGSVLRRKKKRG